MKKTFLFLVCAMMGAATVASAATVKQQRAVVMAAGYAAYLTYTDGTPDLLIGYYNTSWEAQAAGKAALLEAGGPYQGNIGYYKVVGI
ncbi:hypothetical protein [Chitinophaga solisilvae]|uniref:hypothetical protein n=1 Tax=Chitinophaga solisilvae TaxID=1233460 RepID=UPI00136DE68F|nr:hypothetical protein [Chitinophaga solisilvae]